jgi:phosphoribosylformylglycinamidine synthase
MSAMYREHAASPAGALPQNANAILLAMLAHPTVASKEHIVRRYDHEVRGGTIVRPFVGVHMDGPGDAAVLKPLGTWQHPMGFVLSAGINPQIGRCDPYAMAISAVDEAFRNAVAVGADPDRIALLDNFCWGNPTLPDRLGSLVRACQGCHDTAVAYGAPFISGKDSLYNEFNGKPIPGTLLISAIGIVPDIYATVTSDLKQPGDAVYLLGESKDELGGSLLYALHDIAGGAPPSTVNRALDRYRLLHRAIRAGYVRACHDLSEGGLAVALAEMALGGRLGVAVTIPESNVDLLARLFGESNGRLLFEVAVKDIAAVEAMFASETLLRLGEVTAEPNVTIQHAGNTAIHLSVAAILDAWSTPAE